MTMLWALFIGISFSKSLARKSPPIVVDAVGRWLSSNSCLLFSTSMAIAMTKD